MLFGQEEVDALDPSWLSRFARDASNRLTGEGPTSYMRSVVAQKGLLVSTPIRRHITPIIASDNPVLRLFRKECIF